MGKLKSSQTKATKHSPLLAQIKADQLGAGVLSAPGRRAHKRKESSHDVHHVDSRTSNKILALAQEQQIELDALSDEDGELEDLETSAPDQERPFRRRLDEAMEDDPEDEDEDDEEELDEMDDQEHLADLSIANEDHAILQNFMRNPGDTHPPPSTNDILKRLASTPDPNKSSAPSRASTLDPKVIEVYTKIGQLLSRYKSGPLPKAFKILPSLSNWPELLAFTVPEEWTPHAVSAATRIFASNLDPKQSQKFYRGVLLEKMRTEIQEKGNLNTHLYTALKKAIYKPAAFFKGVLFPLCESGNCTLKEAAILGSVIAKVSIPVLHSGAALLRLAEMDYTGPNSLFIRILLDKKYALPYKVVDALVSHFLRFQRDARNLPVLWHQSLLTFAQRYKDDLTPDQRDALVALMRTQVHPQISPEVHRELQSGKGRVDASDNMSIY